MSAMSLAIPFVRPLIQLTKSAGDESPSKVHAAHHPCTSRSNVLTPVANGEPLPACFTARWQVPRHRRLDCKRASQVDR
jgi:hypothetical protein